MKPIQHHRACASGKARGLRTGSQKGIVLISAMIILMVLTILAVSMFRSFGLQERIAGNTRDKQMANHLAEQALQYAEWWLTQSSGGGGAVCNGGALNAAPSICSNTMTLSQITKVPWVSGSTPLGTNYTPPTTSGFALSGSNNSGGTNTYAITPRFYIAALGTNPANPQLQLYQVSAMAEGGKANTISVVQSIFGMQNGIVNAGGL